MKEISPDQITFINEIELRVKTFQTNVSYDPAYGQKHHLQYGFSLEFLRGSKELNISVWDKTSAIFENNRTVVKEHISYQKCFETVKKLVVQKIHHGYQFIPKERFIPNRG